MKDIMGERRKRKKKELERNPCKVKIKVNIPRISCGDVLKRRSRGSFTGDSRGGVGGGLRINTSPPAGRYHW